MRRDECPQCGIPIPEGAGDCPECAAGTGSRRRTGFRFGTGEIIDNRYEVIHRIPGGGMGELYRVRHLHLHDVRAIKLLRSDQIGDANYRERFLREARIAASIKHPNVALLHDFASLPDKTFYMVEEYVEGTTLARALRAGRRFSLNEIVEIAKQVLLGLGAIHEKGIVHRDISPDNIMLADSPEGAIRVKIIDLGIARSVDPSDAHSLTSAGIFVGKPHYASPEQMRLIEDDAPIDHRTDLYSLGVVLYEVVSGKVPFEASTPFEYLLKQLSGEVDAVDRSVADMVPPDLEKFIVKLLRARREDRFESTIEALRVLSKVRVGAVTLQDVPVGEDDAAYPVSAPSQKRRQTAEVPVEQLRRLIEQDRTERGLSPVRVFDFGPPPHEEATSIDEFDDSQKITVLQTPLPPSDTPPPPASSSIPDALQSPSEDDEPVAFLPEIPPAHVQPPPAPEPLPVDAASPTSELHPHEAARRRQSPLIWFIAGIAFVAIVAIGGYLLYRWLDSRFGGTPDIQPAAPLTATMPPAAPTLDAAATTTEVVDAAATTSDAARQEESATPAPAPVSSAASPPQPGPSTPLPTPAPARTAAVPPPRMPSPAVTPPVATPAEEPAVDVPGEAVDTTIAAIPADAPVVLPGSTDDVREGDLVAPGPGVVAAEVLRSVEPIYPPLSANMGHEGATMFSVLVGPDGSVEMVKRIVSSGSEPLDKSAEDAAWKTVFKPATKNGVKVRMWRTLRFQFKKTKGF